MLNHVVLVGRLVEDPMSSIDENGIQISTVVLAIPRSYKNKEGEYDTDFIRIKLTGKIATNVLDYCKKGDLVGVKGILQSNNNSFYDSFNYQLVVVAEKITFLSSKKSED